MPNPSSSAIKILKGMGFRRREEPVTASPPSFSGRPWPWSGQTTGAAKANTALKPVRDGSGLRARLEAGARSTANALKHVAKPRPRVS